MKEVLVVGAGPSGAFLAALLARDGVDVTLVERDRFPRWTVCGACLSGAGVAQLRAEGMEHVLSDGGALPLGQMELRGWGRRADLPLFGGRVLSRAALDLGLVEEARAAGAEVRMGTRARLGRWTGEGREVDLAGPAGPSGRLAARVVVAATGLHPLPRLPEAGGDSGLEHARTSRIGVGAVVDDWAEGPAPGTVRMNVGPGGYVGQVLQEDGGWVVAGALDPYFLREQGGPGPAVEALLRTEGTETRWVVREGWRGTPTLTRTRSHRTEPGVFYLGDAAGYVEPFTGEGMGWGLRGARELRPLVCQAVAGWSADLADRWDRRYAARVGIHQRLCRTVAWLGRRPSLARGAVTALSWAPWLAVPVSKRVAGSGPAVDRNPFPPDSRNGLEPPASPSRT
jgi:flavin-dependent dehydrogenase